MKFKTRLMLFTAAAAAFSANLAYAAIDQHALADSYIADGYSYVEIKQGPTQTKLEAIKDGVVVDVVYSNETGEIISQESQAVDPEHATMTGVEIKMVSADSEDAQNANHDGDHNDTNAIHDGDHSDTNANDDGDHNDTNANDDQGDNNHSTGDDNNGHDGGSGEGDNDGGSGDSSGD